MSGAGTAPNDDEPEMTQVNLRISKAFLEDIDGTWKEEGFNSRSEFLRYAIRDAVKHPAFTREGWKQIAASEHGLRLGDEELVNRDEVVGAMDDDVDQ
ncbi:CopG family transcriptional regulator [Halodesulfurarchaeum formicicum]|uniref:CopG family transcriptional regulator n=1 Tax=Halodesulfurarchaeum formicicum TaxID=1873524 RepID=A0A1D8S6R7_9EURY|nr:MULTISPECIES: ribbon-helix-helix domain-containing protein [Halodesulfurarchaeum]AOW80840.1 CopG family transcriptional regulator [Halodesulfurarchaeum formicicum]AOW81050.1 CopG family transcriptional regulator [Halodesulfurarchaeum formicicum]APE96387.1 CopG family transcriptional regulator [Halodesulfurarchaeum formicicum]MDR5656562.1 ribbon-helix-helix domain-containing protein [Halodesulfurarchaeum sp. HSR-GB]